MRIIILTISFSTLSYFKTQAQESSVSKMDSKYVNWHNRDFEQDQMLGTSVDRTYAELLKNKAAKKTVIVAVIDSGVDIDHEDIKDNIWINEDEIPDNNIDDDHNGYVDDLHGWNFIGGKNGENVVYENFEYTRLYKAGNGPYFLKAKELYEAELAKRTNDKKNIVKFEEIYYKSKAIIKDKTGIDASSVQALDSVNSDDQQILAAKRFLSSRYEKGFEEKMLDGIKKNNSDYFNWFLNLKFNPRTIVGDVPLKLDDVAYGNADVKGQRSDHGTAVAGVIAAVRDNNIGINGIAPNVRIMCIRSTPRGDERDKDVALAIKYAVENGADIINLSFGKAMSPQKKFVDQAVKLAENKGVLIVHGAGNDGKNIDVEESYPSDRYIDETEMSNWINVGASGYSFNDEVAADFSNYGIKHVDLFAPGEKIVSTDSTNTYNINDGTSLSAPVVSGIAAMILSYHPDLKPQQLIQLLLESSKKIDEKVLVPGQTNDEKKKIKFSKLSKSGGIVNAYAAMKQAEGSQ